MLSRREFIKLCMSTTLTLSLTETLLPLVSKAQVRGQIERPPVIWLELGTCTGNSISLDNAKNPNLVQLLTNILDIRYAVLFNSAQGDLAVKAIMDTVTQEAGKFWLIIEGSVMTADNGRFNEVFMRNGQMVTGLAALQEFAPKAKHIIAVGGCACYGGPAAAHPNPGGAKGVWDVVKQQVINVPGCPAHPDWMTGTFTHLLFYGMPELDAYHRPTMFFGKTIHDLCNRRQQFEDGNFAAFPGDDGCLYKVGCKGPVTHADCPTREWNNYVNWPVKAGIPCIGCASPHFPDSMMPFFNHLPDIQTPAVAVNVKKFGAALTIMGVGAIGTHLAAGVFARRIHKHYLEGTKPLDSSPPENVTQLKQELDDLIRRQNALIAESKKLTVQKQRQKRKSLLKRIRDFWHAENSPKGKKE